MHILVIDDEPLAHRTWKRVVRGLPIKLSGVTTYQQAEQFLEGQGCSIDGIILDIRLDPGCGLDLVPKIRACCPTARVLVASAWLDPAAEVRAQGLGLKVVEKGGSLTVLRDALSLITVVDGYGIREIYPDLTDREVEVIEQSIIYDGHRIATAAALGISVKTLKRHWQNISKKIGLKREQILYRLIARRTDLGGPE